MTDAKIQDSTTGTGRIMDIKAELQTKTGRERLMSL
jgi:hypothetical protein